MNIVFNSGHVIIRNTVVIVDYFAFISIGKKMSIFIMAFVKYARLL